jgi:hypothetical protein
MKLTKSDIDVIICMLEDIDSMWGMKPEERDLYERLTTREENDND